MFLHHAVFALVTLLVSCSQALLADDKTPLVRPEIVSLSNELKTTKFDFRKIQICAKLAEYGEEAASVAPLLKEIAKAKDAPQKLRDAANNTLAIIVRPPTLNELLEIVGTEANTETARLEAITEIQNRFWSENHARVVLKEVSDKEKSQSVRNAAAKAYSVATEKRLNLRHENISQGHTKDQLYKVLSNSENQGDQKAAMRGLVNRFLDDEALGAIKEMSNTPGEVGTEAKRILADLELRTRPRLNEAYEKMIVSFANAVSPAIRTDNPALNKTLKDQHYKVRHETLLRVKFFNDRTAVIESYTTLQDTHVETGKVLEPRTVCPNGAKYNYQKKGVMLHFNNDTHFELNGAINSDGTLVFDGWPYGTCGETEGGDGRIKGLVRLSFIAGK